MKWTVSFGQGHRIGLVEELGLTLTGQKVEWQEGESQDGSFPCNTELAFPIPGCAGSATFVGSGELPYNNFDACVCGEGEDSLLGLLDYLAKNAGSGSLDGFAVGGYAQTVVLYKDDEVSFAVPQKPGLTAEWVFWGSGSDQPYVRLVVAFT